MRKNQQYLRRVSILIATLFFVTNCIAAVPAKAKGQMKQMQGDQHAINVLQNQIQAVANSIPKQMQKQQAMTQKLFNQLHLMHFFLHR